jgi:hypothetical protein
VSALFGTNDDIGNVFVLRRAPNALLSLDDDDYTCSVIDVLTLEIVIAELRELEVVCEWRASERGMHAGLVEMLRRSAA